MVGKTRKAVTSYEGKEVFLRRTLSRGSQNGIGVLTDRGRRTSYGCCRKGMLYLPNFHAKMDSTITKYIGHNFTKVTTFIIIVIKNNYKNCYLGKIIWEGSLVKTMSTQGTSQ